MDEDPFIVATLYGKFRGEDDHQWHCLPIPDKTRTRIPARGISQKLKRMVKVKDLTTGPFFCTLKGKPAKMNNYNEEFRLLIGAVKKIYPKLILNNATPAIFSLWQSLCRRATATPTCRVGKDVIELYN